MSQVTISLPAGSALTVSADANSSGRVWTFAERLGDTAGATTIAASASETFGPFAVAKWYMIESLTGTLSHSSAPVDYPTAAEALAAAIAALPTYAMPVIGTVGDLREIVGEGAPVDYTDGDPAGTGEGVAGKGSRYTDITNGTLYINTGTKAEPAWTQLAPVA